MSEIQNINSIESSSLLSPPVDALLLEHAFKLHKGSAIVQPLQKSSFPKGQLPGIFRTLESITTNSTLPNILIGNPRLLAIVSKFPALLNVLINNPALLTILELRPSLIGIAITNPKILYLLAQRPALLALVSANPRLLSLLISNPSLFNLLVNRPGLLGLIAKSSGLLTQLIANPDLLTNKNIPTPLIKPPKQKTFIPESMEFATRQLTLNKLLLKNKPADKRFVTNQVNANLRTLLSGKRLSRTKIGIVLNEILSTFQKLTKNVTVSLRALISGIPVKVLPAKINLSTITQAQAKTLNPALLAQIGAIAITANKGRVIPTSGNPEDWGIGLETQSEKQLRVVQEPGPVHEVEEAQEPKLV